MRWFAERVLHYHKCLKRRTAFSMMKRKFGAFVRSRSPAAQINEILCKVLCHNLCAVLEASYGGTIESEVAAG